jgi:Flp pilus assembly CpaF family ATPase
VNVRKFVVCANTLDELVDLGTLTPAAATFLDTCVAAGLNVLVAGGTQAGKTTMLNCLTAAVPARERVITCEKVFELADACPYVTAVCGASARREPLRSARIAAVRTLSRLPDSAGCTAVPAVRPSLVSESRGRERPC